VRQGREAGMGCGGSGGTPEWAAARESGAGGHATQHGAVWDGSGRGAAALEKATVRSLALEKGATWSFFFEKRTNKGRWIRRSEVQEVECRPVCPNAGALPHFFLFSGVFGIKIWEWPNGKWIRIRRGGFFF
jgi:hypothetical protein